MHALLRSSARWLQGITFLSCCPIFTPLQSMTAPFTTRNSTISRWPALAAACSGVVYMCKKQSILPDAFYFKTGFIATNLLSICNVHISTLVNQVFHSSIVPILSSQTKWRYLCTHIRFQDHGYNQISELDWVYNCAGGISNYTRQKSKINQTYSWTMNEPHLFNKKMHGC